MNQLVVDPLTISSRLLVILKHYHPEYYLQPERIKSPFHTYSTFPLRAPFIEFSKLEENLNDSLKLAPEYKKLKFFITKDFKYLINVELGEEDLKNLVSLLEEMLNDYKYDMIPYYLDIFLKNKKYFSYIPLCTKLLKIQNHPLIYELLTFEKNPPEEIFLSFFYRFSIKSLNSYLGSLKKVFHHFNPQPFVDQMLKIDFKNLNSQISYGQLLYKFFFDQKKLKVDLKKLNYQALFILCALDNSKYSTQLNHELENVKDLINYIPLSIIFKSHESLSFKDKIIKVLFDIQFLKKNIEYSKFIPSLLNSLQNIYKKEQNLQIFDEYFQHIFNQFKKDKSLLYKYLAQCIIDFLKVIHNENNNEIIIELLSHYSYFNSSIKNIKLFNTNSKIDSNFSVHRKFFYLHLISFSKEFKEEWIPFLFENLQSSISNIQNKANEIFIKFHKQEWIPFYVKLAKENKGLYPFTILTLPILVKNSIYSKWILSQYYKDNYRIFNAFVQCSLTIPIDSLEDLFNYLFQLIKLHPKWIQILYETILHCQDYQRKLILVEMYLNKKN